MTNGKIPALLAEYKRQSESATSEKSSLSYATRQFTNASEAEQSFHHFHSKLLRVDEWNTKSAISSFELYDENGNRQLNKNAAVNDFIKISLPGSGKDDWVKIIDIHDTADEMALTVQPSQNPTEKDSKEKTTSHFFTDDSTNNFCLERQQETINLYVIGLTERANTEDTKNILESIRNYATANLGHYFGIQEGEWAVFAKNFLEIKE